MEPFTWLCGSNKLDVLEKLLEANNQWLKLVYNMAYIRKNEDILKLLKDKFNYEYKPKIDVEFENVCSAITNNKLEVLETAYNNGFYFSNLNNIWLEQAIWNNNIPIIKFLLDKGISRYG